MFVGSVDDSLRDDFDESLCNPMVFMSHVVTYLFSIDIEKAHLDSLYYLLSDFPFSFSILFDLIFDFLDVFGLVFLDSLELFWNVHQKELFVLRILAQISEKGVSDIPQIFFELLKKWPNPQILILYNDPFSNLEVCGPTARKLSHLDFPLYYLVVFVARQEVRLQIRDIVEVVQQFSEVAGEQIVKLFGR